MRIILILLALTGCTNHLQEVNKRINSYKYMDSNSRIPKTPTQFYKDGGGNCLDYANVKKAELGGDIVLRSDIINGRTHAVLKVGIWLLDSKFDGPQLALLEKTYPYSGDK